MIKAIQWLFDICLVGSLNVAAFYLMSRDISAHDRFTGAALCFLMYNTILTQSRRFDTAMASRECSEQ